MPSGQLPALVAYAGLLAHVAVPRGLLGPAEVDRLWERHLFNCAWVAELIPRAARVADLGSGAGLPGVVLALVRPDLTVDLVDAQLRRVRFLTEVVDRLGLSGVRVRQARAEEHRPGDYDVVTARALAPLDRLAGWSLPWLRPGGRLLALKGRRAADEVASGRQAISASGGTVLGVHEPRAADLAGTAVVSVVRHAPRQGTRQGTGRGATRQ